MTVDLTIDRLGALGDGIADTANGPVYVPFALSSENARATMSDGRAAEIKFLSRSPDRIEMACPHFTRCGGCQIQHLVPAHYVAWKRQRIVEALEARGFTSPPVADPLAISPGTRRRLTLTATRRGKDTVLGLSVKGLNQVVGIAPCPVLVPEIEAALPALQQLVSPYASPKKVMKLHITAGDAGLDLDVSGGPRLTLQIESALALAAAKLDLARLTWDREPVSRPGRRSSSWARPG